MPSPPAAELRSNDESIRRNRGFYEPLWTRANLVEPSRFNTWPLLQALADEAPRRLEVAPGLRRGCRCAAPASSTSAMPQYSGCKPAGPPRCMV